MTKLNNTTNYKNLPFTKNRFNALLQHLKLKPSNQHKASRVSSLLALQTQGRPVWTPRQYDKLTEEGYQRNVIAYRCVNLIARNVASVPWLLYRNDHEVLQHPLLDVLRTPNPLQTRTAFIEAVATYLMLAGNAYVEAVHEGGLQELYVLRPDRMQVIPGSGGVPGAYVYTVNGQKRTIPVEQHSGLSPILHLKMFHPLHDWYGLSPIEAAASAIDEHNAVGAHNLALLQNGGRPSGALLFKTGDRLLSEEQRLTLRSDLQSMHEGASNAGRILVLEGDMDWREMGLSPKDLDFMTGKNISAREIAQAYGVPPMLVGVMGDATFANYREARLHLWEDTVLPLLDKIIAEMNRWLTSLYGENLRFAYDMDRIPALSVKREAVWARVQNADFLTMDEKREAVGYSPMGEK